MSAQPLPQNQGEVNAKHLDTFLKNMDDARKDVKSRYEDLLTAFRKHEDLIIGNNTTTELAKCTYIPGILEDPDPPRIDASCFTIEKRNYFLEAQQTIIASMSYYIDISAFLIEKSRTSNVIENMKLQSPQVSSLTEINVQSKSIWRSLWDKVTFERPERKKFEKVVGILEAKFQHLQLAYVLCNRYFDQRNNKFMNIRIEHQNPRALGFLILKDWRNFQHMQRTILSVLDFGYRLDLEKRLEMQARAAQNMMASNAAAQQTSANAIRPELPQIGNGLGGG